MIRLLHHKFPSDFPVTNCHSVLNERLVQPHPPPDSSTGPEKCYPLQGGAITKKFLKCLLENFSDFFKLLSLDGKEQIYGERCACVWACQYLHMRVAAKHPALKKMFCFVSLRV